MSHPGSTLLSRIITFNDLCNEIETPTFAGLLWEALPGSKDRKFEYEGSFFINCLPDSKFKCNS